MDAIIQSNPVMEIAQELQNVETFLKQADFYKKKEKELREQLLKALEAAGLGSIKTSEGVSFSVVKGTEDELVDVETFDLALFKAENPEIYQKYATKSVQVKEGKKPSISIRGLKKKGE